MTGVIGHVVVLGAIIFAVSMLLAPFESLGWWAGWLGAHDEPEEAEVAADRAPEPGQAPEGYVVFLAGIASISGTDMIPAEIAFLERLRKALPGHVVVHDVFPYAPSGRPLITGQRVFRWLWRIARRWHGGQTMLLPPILHVRNIFQVLVAADNRYGPIYGYGLSRIILARLAAHGYVPEADRPVVLLGSSGGGQIAIRAAPYLRAAIGAPVSVVAFGGVMASDRGVTESGRLISLYGSGDYVYRLARLAFPGRWALFAGSHWNRAARERRLVERVIGPMRHSGRGGYLDARGEISNLDVTVREVGGAVRSIAAEATAKAA